MVACEKDLGGDKVAALIQKGASLVQTDYIGCSAFSYVISTSYTLNPSLVTPFLKKLGITDQELQTYSTWSKLCAYIKDGIFSASTSSLTARIGLSTLLNDKKQSNRTLSEFKEKSLSEKFNIAEELSGVLGKKMVDSFFNISSEHLKKSAPLVVNQLPSDASLTTLLDSVLDYVNSLWPDSLMVWDDVGEGEIQANQSGNRSKTELYTVLRVRLAELQEGRLSSKYKKLLSENLAMLKNMYGHILITVNKRIATVSSMTKKQKEEFGREIKNFVQRIGISFFHCGDRLTTDAINEYLRFVKNIKQTGDEKEIEKLKAQVYQELETMRQKAFDDAYFAFSTDQHDTATQRYMRTLFNEELGLGLPQFASGDDYSGGYAKKELAPSIKQKFQESYTLSAIIACIQKLATTNRGFHSTQLQLFFDDLFKDLSVDEKYAQLGKVYDLEAVPIALTPYGIQVMLTRLGVIQFV